MGIGWNSCPLGSGMYDGTGRTFRWTGLYFRVIPAKYIFSLFCMQLVQGELMGTEPRGAA